MIFNNKNIDLLVENNCFAIIVGVSKHDKDYIGPSIKKTKLGMVPEGPTAEHSHKLSQGMGAARSLFKKEPVKVEGTKVDTPLPLAPPIQLPPGTQSSRQAAPKTKVEVKIKDGKVLDPQQLMGNSHINSYQTLLANDRMEKPRIKAWTDDESKEP